MKKSLMIIIGCVAIALSGSSFSWSKFDSCQEEAGCGDNYCNTCQCTDNGYGKNNCMSGSRYCEAFGNVGAR